MKAKFIRVSAMLLMLWYCFSIIGFNVHTCNASGRSFVATFITGLSCSDIHPEHKCDKNHCGAEHDEHCCGGHKEPSFNPQDCCSNDRLALVVTGCALDDSHRYQDLLTCAVLPLSCQCHACMPCLFDSSQEQSPPGNPIAKRDFQSLLNIWRI